MHMLTSSGLTVKDSLELCSMIDENKTEIPGKLLQKINGGLSFGNAARQMEDTFGPIYSGIICMGDKTGNMAIIFEKLAQYLEARKKIRNSLIQSMIYPASVIIVSMVMMAIIRIYAMPRLESIFDAFGGKEGEILRNNMHSLTQAITSSIIFILSSSLCLAFLKIGRCRNERMRKTVDSAALRLPFIGKCIRYLESMNFSFAMETLTGSGLSVEESLLMASNVMSNTVMKEAVREIHDEIQSGKSMSESFRMHDVFPKIFHSWLSIGERCGESETSFHQLEIFFQSETAKFTSRTMKLAEPLVSVLLGMIIMAVTFKIVIPIFNMYGSIGA